EYQTISSLALQRPLDLKPTCLEVHVLPLESQGLANPEASRAQHDPERVPPRSAAGRQQDAELRRRQGGHLLLIGPWQGDQLGRIRLDQTPVLSLVESPMENSVRLENGARREAARFQSGVCGLDD